MGRVSRFGWTGVRSSSAEPRDACCFAVKTAGPVLMTPCQAPLRRGAWFIPEDPAFARALLAAAPPVLAGQLRDLAAAARRKRSRGRRYVLAGALALVALAVGGYWGMRGLGRVAVEALPVSVDEKIGDLAYRQMTLPVPREGDAVTAAVQTMVERLAPHAKGPKMDFRVAVVDGPTVNAFCLPGGRIVVYTGLLRRAANADQVAGVLAHEMAHATMRHGVARVAQSLGVVAAVQLVFGDLSGVAVLAAELAKTGVLTSFSREHETEADLEGLRMAHAAGVEGAALIDFFATLEEVKGDVPDALSWLASHPQLSERQARLGQAWGRWGRSVGCLGRSTGHKSKRTYSRIYTWKLKLRMARRSPICGRIWGRGHPHRRVGGYGHDVGECEYSGEFGRWADQCPVAPVSGEGIVVREHLHGAGGGEVVLTQPFPGDMTAIRLNGNSLYLQPGAFVACEPGVAGHRVGRFCQLF